MITDQHSEKQRMNLGPRNFGIIKWQMHSFVGFTEKSWHKLSLPWWGPLLQKVKGGLGPPWLPGSATYECNGLVVTNSFSVKNICKC